MKRRIHSRFSLLLVALVAIAACSTNRHIAGQPGGAGTVRPLAGTAWQLVEIVPMDDHAYRPDDPSRYTLEFNADGAVRVRADCNRGTGSWTSESAGQLQFGPIATTRALCPPGSLSERYLEQFLWVRSYIIKDGRLFLATMADGSIIEFEPLPVHAEPKPGNDVHD